LCNLFDFSLFSFASIARPVRTPPFSKTLDQKVIEKLAPFEKFWVSKKKEVETVWCNVDRGPQKF